RRRQRRARRACRGRVPRGPDPVHAREPALGPAGLDRERARGERDRPHLGGRPGPPRAPRRRERARHQAARPAAGVALEHDRRRPQAPLPRPRGRRAPAAGDGGRRGRRQAHADRGGGTRGGDGRPGRGRRRTLGRDVAAQAECVRAVTGDPDLGAPGATAWYFAYGSNIETATFSGRRGIAFLCAVPARLAGWRLVLDKPGIVSVGHGFANIVPDDTTVVLGVLYEMRPADLDHLDLTEGVLIGNYRRVEVVAETLASAATRVAAQTFVSDRRDISLRPSTRYLACLI